ncbi:MAG: hypothetical protein GEU88_03830 [Solirubrobacterales bacterium]|nr:hypothetical protein [Solirubrobacterales bacterium]
MTGNPFVIDSPVAPEDLIDREAEAERLGALAEGGHNARLSAPRRFGKTSLLRRVGRDADLAGMATVYVDFFGALTLDDVVARFEFAYESALRGPLARWYAGFRRRWRPSIRIGPPEASVEVRPLSDDDATRALLELLELPVHVLERDGRRTLAMFDEFQAVLSVGAGLDGLIRSRIQQHGDVASYLFAGSHPGLMAELFGSRERPLYGQARALVLGPLGDEDLAAYIGERFERSGKRVDSALAPLLGLVQGHPQRAMLAAHHLWERTPEAARADEATWSSASEAMLSELEDSFERIWEDFSTNERRVMAAVAWGGPWGGGSSLYAKSTLERFRLSKGTARDVRGALLRRGEIEHAGQGRVRIVDPLLEAWIATGRRSRW